MYHMILVKVLTFKNLIFFPHSNIETNRSRDSSNIKGEGGKRRKEKDTVWGKGVGVEGKEGGGYHH